MAMQAKASKGQICCDDEDNLGTQPAAEHPGEMTYCKNCARTWLYPGPLSSGPGPNKSRTDF